MMNLIYVKIHTITSFLFKILGYRIIKSYRFPQTNCNLLDIAVAILRLRRGEIKFIQIGANDGVLNDPLRKHLVLGGFAGVMVEPIPDIFEKMKDNCKEYKKVSFINCAISDKENSEFVLWVPKYINSGNYHQKASADLKTLLKNAKILHHDIKPINIPCTTLKLLMDSMGLETVDLLVVDAEGHDFNIIEKALEDFIEPSVIFFEVLHLSKIQRLKIRSLLKEYGYCFIEDLKDCLAMKLSLIQ
jgi:FkbM family methyltransferase